MSNVYPDSVIVTGLMVPTVRVAVIEHMDKLKGKAFLLTLDKLIQFDESEDIAETLFDEV